MAIPLLDAIPPVSGSLGRPRFRPIIYQGDAAYGWQCNIDDAWERGVFSLLARPRGKHGSGLGVTRYVVERALAWFTHFRRLRLCYERCNEHLQAFHDLAGALIVHKKWLSFLAG
jgi:transposase